MTPDIGKLLAEVKAFIQPVKERTLFSLGGRGYYENPASDLLAFFLSPEGDHGFGALFLQAFLDCMEVNSSDLSFSGVSVSREAQTKEGNRIDLVIQGPEWVLLIENKVYHGQVNPFDTYEAYGRMLAGGKKLLLAILSPSGTAAIEGWNPVSYQNYCAALRQGLSTVLFDRAYSKWVVFAREFILHFENELYQPSQIMTEQEADFVEQNAEAIVKVKKLAADYRQFVLALLKTRLSEAVSGHEITTKDDGWAVRCFSDKWGRSNLAFWTTAPGAPGKKFQMTVYLAGLDDAQRADAHTAFQGMKPWTEGSWMAWQTQPGFDSRPEAVTEACRLAKVISGLFPTLIEPAPPEDSEQPTVVGGA